MMVKATWLCLALCVLVPSMVHAQGGSNYSALGVGDIRPWVGGMYDAMSGTSIAMPTPHGINTVNPALLGYSPTTRLQAGYRFNQAVITDDVSSLRQNNGSLDGLLAMFSVDTAQGFGVSVGVLPYSKVSYLVTRAVTTEVDGNTIEGISQQLGEGGVSQLQIGASVRLFGALRLGLQGSGLFGILTYTDDTQLGGLYSEVYSSQKYDVRGMIFKAAMYWEGPGGLGVGGFASLGTKASNYITRRASGAVSGNFYFDTTEISETSSDLPTSFGVGISYPIGSGRFGADVRMADYTNVTVNNRLDAAYTTSLRTSIAYAHYGSQSPVATFWKRIGWYFGAGYEKLYVTFQGDDILEYSGSGGISFPLGGNAMVDAGIIGGVRAPSTLEGLTEYFGRLTITVSIGETWFKPFARD